jgi:2-polyprenyl-3-methyl-5-hydroxy-6-metoxy-1,4-benzoquinol methylase
MDRYKETFETWNKIASFYQDKFMTLDLYDETYDFICEKLDFDKPQVLDIGCGPGNITKYLLSKRPDFKITGIDIAPNMIELAKENNPTARFKVMDSRQINDLETKFNAVICGFCIPYMSESDCSKLMIDCNDVLTDDGILYLSFVEGDPNNSGFQVGSNGDRIYFYYHSLKNLEQLLLDNCFEPFNVFKINYDKGEGNIEIHTILIAKKAANL